MSKPNDIQNRGTAPVYYIRHKLCYTSENVRQYFIREGIVAIHYADVKSWNIHDYQGYPKSKQRGLKKALDRFKKLAGSGAWVIADYQHIRNVRSDEEKDMIVIGKADEYDLDYYVSEEQCHPKTLETHLKQFRKGKHFFKKHHIYKILKLNEPKKFPKDKYDLLRLPLGRDTICESHRINAETVKAIYEETSLPVNVKSLVPAQLELLCQEYLRRFPSERIPKLEYLLSPIGKQMKYIDINGSAANGARILCQVSQAENGKEVSNKIEKLRDAKDPKRILVYFGSEEPSEHEGVNFVNIVEVLEKMKTDPVCSKMVETFLTLRS